MPSLDDVRSALDKDELDYPALAQELGAAAIPELTALVREDEPRIASKATYLAGLIDAPDAHEVVALAADSRHDVVRVAAAAALPSLASAPASDLARRLMTDSDVGVRSRAVQSAARLEDPALGDHVDAIATGDPVPELRKLAAGLRRAEPAG